MGLGQCAEAAKLFRKSDSKVPEMGIINAFNYGIACWGADRIIHRDIFERAAEIDQSDNDNFGAANYFQCMAIAYWATGETGIALDKTSKSQKLIADWRTMLD